LRVKEKTEKLKEYDKMMSRMRYEIRGVYDNVIHNRKEFHFFLIK